MSKERKTQEFLVCFFNQAANFSHEVRMTSVPFKKGDGVLIFQNGDLHMFLVSNPPVKWTINESEGIIRTEIHVTYQDVKPNPMKVGGK